MEDEITCRICLEGPLSRKDVICPCNCRGSSKWVHRACLDRWRTTREDRAFSRCTECLTDYVLVCRNEDSSAARHKRQRQYIFAIVRDFGGALFLSQAAFALLALLVYGSDYKGGLLNSFHAQDHPKVFYYLCGVFIALAIIGLVFTLTRTCGTCGSNDCAPTYCYYDPVPYNSDPCCCIACGDSPGCCSTAGAGDCTCASAEFGAEAGPVLIVIAVGFAFVGLIVAVVAGVAFVQHVVQRHMHILHKRGMAADYIVWDLEAEGRANVDVEVGHELPGGGMRHGVEMRAQPAMPHRTGSEPLYSAINPLLDPVAHGAGGIPPHAEGAGAGALSPSAPPLSMAQRRELANLGLL